MKKLLLCVSFLILGIPHLSAQIEQKQSILNLGVGLGSIYSIGGFTTSLPPIEGSYEYMFTDAISVGGYAGLASYTIEFTAFDESDSYDFVNVGAVGNYHLVNNGQWNVYGGGRLGYLSVKRTADQPSDKDDPLGIFRSSDVRSSGISYGLQAGARYFFTPSFTANAELGLNLSILKIGISYIF